MLTYMLSCVIVFLLSFTFVLNTFRSSLHSCWNFDSKLFALRLQRSFSCNGWFNRWCSSLFFHLNNWSNAGWSRYRNVKIRANGAIWRCYHLPIYFHLMLNILVDCIYVCHSKKRKISTWKTWRTNKQQIL